MREFAVDFVEEQYLESKLNQRRSDGWLLHTLSASEHVADANIIRVDHNGYRRQRFTAVWVKFSDCDGFPTSVPLGFNLI